MELLRHAIVADRFRTPGALSVLPKRLVCNSGNVKNGKAFSIQTKGLVFGPKLAILPKTKKRKKRTESRVMMQEANKIDVAL